MLAEIVENLAAAAHQIARERGAPGFDDKRNRRCERAFEDDGVFIDAEFGIADEPALDKLRAALLRDEAVDRRGPPGYSLHPFSMRWQGWSNDITV